MSSSHSSSPPYHQTRSRKGSEYDAEKIDAEAAKQICDAIGVKHKTYIIPELETMDLKINQQLLAGSNPPVGGSTNNKDDLLAPEFDFDE